MAPEIPVLSLEDVALDYIRRNSPVGITVVSMEFYMTEYAGCHPHPVHLRHAIQNLIDSGVAKIDYLLRVSPA